MEQIKGLEQLVFKFLWNNKPDKVSRDHSKLRETAGGLGVTDIGSFWSSLKFSWLKRLINSSAFWPKVLMLEISDILGFDVKDLDIIKLGPQRFTFIGNKLKNQLWKTVFLTVAPIMQGAISCYPEKILFAPLWDNPLIVRNNRSLRKQDYRLLSNIDTIADFYHPISGAVKTRDELEASMKCIIDNETYICFLYILNWAKRKIGLRDTTNLATQFPFQPLLIKILTFVRTGCSFYY